MPSDMFNIKFYYFLVVFFFVESTIGLKKTPQCDIELPIKNCLKLGFLFEANGKKFEDFPTTLSGMNKACEDLTKHERCAQDFITRCTDTSKEERVLGHLLEGHGRVFKRICRTNTRKNELLQHVPCANSVIDDTYRCVGDYKKLVYAANKLQDKDKILRILCCKIREVVPCVGKAMKSKGADVCPTKSREYFKEMQLKVREEMTSVVCADFERDSCQNVLVPSVSEEEYAGKDLYEPIRQLYKKVFV